MFVYIGIPIYIIYVFFFSIYKQTKLVNIQSYQFRSKGKELMTLQNNDDMKKNSYKINDLIIIIKQNFKYDIFLFKTNIIKNVKKNSLLMNLWLFKKKNYKYEKWRILSRYAYYDEIIKLVKIG